MQTGNPLIDTASTRMKEWGFPLATQAVESMSEAPLSGFIPDEADSVEFGADFTDLDGPPEAGRDPSSDGVPQPETLGAWPMSALTDNDLSTTEGKNAWSNEVADYIKAKIAEKYSDPEDQKAAWDIIRKDGKNMRQYLRDDGGNPDRGPASAPDFDLVKFKKYLLKGDQE